MRYQLILRVGTLCLAFALANPTTAHDTGNAPISVHILDTADRPYAEYPAERRGESPRDTHRAYVEARPGEHYGIRITNRTRGRIGVVVAVDGRNILDGTRSNLTSNEAMYVLGPYASSVYRGWRVSKNAVRSFYFTTADNSYAGRIGDRSAIGVIAIATFDERTHHWTSRTNRTDSHVSDPNNTARGLGSEPDMSPETRQANPSEAGTGYGSARKSPSVTTAFEPHHQHRSRYFYKYQWRHRLIELGVIQPRSNRFWPREPRIRFVPPPPKS